jgi:hypothetical protein
MYYFYNYFRDTLIPRAHYLKYLNAMGLLFSALPVSNQQIKIFLIKKSSLSLGILLVEFIRKNVSDI